MAHQVETILASIITILKAGSTDAATRVYRGRELPVEATEGAGDVICVYEGDESSRMDGQTQFSPLKRELPVFVELHKRSLPTDANDPGALETALNDFALEAEIALQASFSLSNACDWFEHVGTTRARAQAEREYRVLTLQLVVHYRTVRTNPAVRA